MKSAAATAVRAGGVLRATRTPEGAGTIAIRRSGGELEAEAWGPGAAWLLDNAGGLLGLEDDTSLFDPPPGTVRDLHRRFPGLRLGKTLRPFEVVVTAILGQRVSGKQAAVGHRRLVAAHGEPAPGPHGIRLVPAPERLATLPYHEYHRFEIERARAARLIEAARRSTRIEETVAMERDAAMRRLEAIPGIGEWTAAAVLGVAFGDPDAVQVGDYHNPHTVSWALAGEPRGDDGRMLELLEPYRGQRRRVLVLLKAAGITAPRFGPRSPITSIRGI